MIIRNNPLSGDSHVWVLEDPDVVVGVFRTHDGALKFIEELEANMGHPPPTTEHVGGFTKIFCAYESGDDWDFSIYKTEVIDQ